MTFGMGVFWLLVVSGVGETVVRAAQALGQRSQSEGGDVRALERRIEFVNRLLEERSKSALPPGGSRT